MTESEIGSELWTGSVNKNLSKGKKPKRLFLCLEDNISVVLPSTFTRTKPKQWTKFEHQCIGTSTSVLLKPAEWPTPIGPHSALARSLAITSLRPLLPLLSVDCYSGFTGACKILQFEGLLSFSIEIFI